MTGYLRTTQFWLFLLTATYLSLTSSPPGAIEVFSDKILHSAGYFMLLLSWDLAYSPNRKLSEKILLLLIYSIIIEIIQHFIPNREFSGLDILANLTGLIWGVLFIIYLKPKVMKIVGKEM